MINHLSFKFIYWGTYRSEDEHQRTWLVITRPVLGAHRLIHSLNHKMTVQSSTTTMFFDFFIRWSRDSHLSSENVRRRCPLFLLSHDRSFIKELRDCEPVMKKKWGQRSIFFFSFLCWPDHSSLFLLASSQRKEFKRKWLRLIVSY